MFNILFWTGIRSGELLALTADDFDHDAFTMRINKNYARVGNQDMILDPKTPKSNRTVTIPKFLSDMVKDSTNEQKLSYNGRVGINN